MIDDFLKDVKLRNSKKTYKTYHSFLIPFEKWLKKNNKSFNDCSYRDVYDYIEGKEDWGKATKRYLITVVKQLFKWYSARIPMGVTTDELRHAFQEKQRAEQIITMKYPSQLKGSFGEKRKGLSMDELKRLLEKAEHYDKLLIYILSYFAFRKSELIWLSKNLNKIDFKKKRIDFLGSKTYEVRFLYFNDYVSKLLGEYIKKPVKRYYELNNRLRRYNKFMSFPIYPHIFRGTFNSHMRRVLKDDTLTKILMGHKVKKSDMTARYDDKEMLGEDIKIAMQDLHYMKDLRI